MEFLDVKEIIVEQIQNDIIIESETFSTIINSLPVLDLENSEDWIIKQQYGKFLNIGLQGPTRESNWLIPKTTGPYGSILVGGYADKRGYLDDILNAGIETFVCLNSEYGRMTDTNIYNSYAVGKIPEDKFIHLKIEDMGIASVEEVKELSRNIANRFLNGEHIYIHCSGGHGRTGTIAAIVLYMLYPDLTITQIFDYIQFAHDQRVGHYLGPYYFTKGMKHDTLAQYFKLGQVPTPQTYEQRQQVVDIILDYELDQDLDQELDQDLDLE